MQCNFRDVIKYPPVKLFWNKSVRVVARATISRGKDKTLLNPASDSGLDLSRARLTSNWAYMYSASSKEKKKFTNHFFY